MLEFKTCCKLFDKKIKIELFLTTVKYTVKYRQIYNSQKNVPSNIQSSTVKNTQKKKKNTVPPNIHRFQGTVKNTKKYRGKYATHTAINSFSSLLNTSRNWIGKNRQLWAIIIISTCLPLLDFLMRLFLLGLTTSSL